MDPVLFMGFPVFLAKILQRLPLPGLHGSKLEAVNKEDIRRRFLHPQVALKVMLVPMLHRRVPAVDWQCSLRHRLLLRPFQRLRLISIPKINY